MPSPFKSITVIAACVFLSASTSLAEAQSTGLSSDELVGLQICEGVTQLFEQFPDSVWPGYNLATTPYMFYIPDKWALLVNRAEPLDDFGFYPADWPPLGTDALLHRGQYDDLIGQLGFGTTLDSLNVVAIPDGGDPPLTLFAFVVHEAFHQYQMLNFGEIPWAREELYPIEDSENTSLAALEMVLLMHALTAADIHDDARCREWVNEFIAVRHARWARDDFVAEYEQGQEINEGTAKYVEVKATSLMPRIEYVSNIDGPQPLAEAFRGVTMPQYLIDDFMDRMTGGTVAPDDMLRNRIYPVGCAEGFLLDHFGIAWKAKAQEAGSEFTFAGLFQNYLHTDTSQFDTLVQRAKNDWKFDSILAASSTFIGDYHTEMQAAVDTFEAQSGYRVAVEMQFKSLRRSRRSSARKWISNRGTIELRNPYQVYTLSNDDFKLELQNTGVLEQNDWDTKHKTVVAYVPDISEIAVDGKTIEIEDMPARSFTSVHLSGDQIDLEYAKGGTIEIAGTKIHLSLTP